MWFSVVLLAVLSAVSFFVIDIAAGLRDRCSRQRASPVCDFAVGQSSYLVAANPHFGWHLAVAEEHDALASAGIMQTTTQLGEVGVAVHNFAIDREMPAIVMAIVEGNPATSELHGVMGVQGPTQTSLLHSDIIAFCTMGCKRLFVAGLVKSLKKPSICSYWR